MSPESRLTLRHKAQRVWRLCAVYSLDLLAFAFSTILAFELRFDGALPVQYFHPMLVALCVWAGVKSGCFIAGAVGRGSWRHTSVYDGVRLVLANSAGSVLGGLVIFVLVGPWSIPRSVYILDWLISCLLTEGARLAVRVAVTAKSRGSVDGEQTKTLIYGAGAAGRALLWELRQNQTLMCDVVGLVDDDPSKVGLVMDGKRVLGTGEALKALVRKRAIKRVLIAIPAATGPQMVRILKFATDAKVEYKMVPSLGELVQGTELGKQIREVAVEDLLGRKPVQLDLDKIRERIQGRVVMVTGAAGSIGSEICRQIAPFRPLAIVGFDQAETPLFHIDREMTSTFPGVTFHPEIGSVTSRSTLKRVIQHYHPSILYHAAAYKHVPLMEKHVFAAVETNIFGTLNVARAAAEYGVDDFVMISSDKAVRPTSMMGATKRIAELLIRALQAESNTKFVSVRFGNVLGSNGSVIPIFKEQIASGGPITVTHPDMTRYFMTIPEASQLVLQASTIGKGGEVFVLEMGQPVKIIDLAKNLILLSGFQPERDIEIQFTGLRPGEKMFEELNLQDEHLIPTSHAKIRSYVCQQNYDPMQIKASLQRLQAIAEGQDVANLVLLLKELIPDYNPGTELLKAALSIKPYDADPEKTPARREQVDAKLVVKLTPAALLN
ncbi:MAG: nucleoside-diphosphate sugar epimerase/dehydratase [Terracidiphilus sp.]|nr:nucleoside-diphosphate sugar epimerase/dehydratase [Terracidiphilus sp.]